MTHGRCLRRSARARACATASVLALSWAARARADHSAEEHITDETAWTLEGDKAWRLGIFKAAVTAWDRVTLATYVVPWVVAAPNAQLKWRFYSSGAWHWAVQAGFVRWTGSNLDTGGDDAPEFSVGSFELLQSTELGARHQLSHDLIFTAVRGRAEIEGDGLSGGGVAGVSNLQYVASYEYRFSRHLAVVVSGRLELARVIAAQTRLTAQPDEFTTIEFVGDARAERLSRGGAYSIVPSLVWSWQTFNLRLGLGYGHFNVPVVNFMLAEPTVVPDLDLYWTF